MTNCPDRLQATSRLDCFLTSSNAAYKHWTSERERLPFKEGQGDTGRQAGRQL